MAAESAAEWMLAGLGPGAVVAGYRVESRIGAGGMAVVLRARDESLGRLVALKVLAPALADDAAFRERFIRESRAAAAVDHPHIIPVYAAGESGGVLYIAMRYVPGGDLRALLHREAPLPADRVAYLLYPVASALDTGHDAGLVHRDVKPANILIDSSPGRTDHPYLADFGLAKGSTGATGLTGSGQFLGTLEYCAPEQIGGKRAVPQTDQYALGCVAYHMLTGTVPFPREEATAILWAHMSEAPPPVTALRHDLPSPVDEVVGKALAKTPEDRYATCGEFVAALRAALGTHAFPGFPRTGAQGTTQPADNVIAQPPTARPVPPSPPSTPPQPSWVGPPSEFGGPTQDVTVPRSSGSPAQIGNLGGKVIRRPGASAVPPRPGVSQGVKPSRHRIGRRTGIAAAAIAVAAGGATAAALLSARQPPVQATYLSSSLGLIATLTDPSGGQPTAVGFKSDKTVVTIDASGNAYTWNIAVREPVPTPTDFNAASAVTAKGSGISPDGKLVASEEGQSEGIQLRNTATGKVISTLVPPGGVSVQAFAFSPDGTELAGAGANNATYIWRISR